MTPSVLSLTKTSARSQPGEDHNLAPLDCPVAADERQQMLVRWCILHSPGLPRGVCLQSFSSPWSPPLLLFESTCPCGSPSSVHLQSSINPFPVCPLLRKSTWSPHGWSGVDRLRTDWRRTEGGLKVDDIEQDSSRTPAGLM